ncbi:TPA: hypothetical protein NNT57_004609 [Salmonella enterica]|uniref:DUF6950 domain-containing protein n=3 Tax=Lokivirus IMEAB3 TaxID=2560266 RepID=A0A481S2J6_9CAUD|nr:hypothetical protein CH11_gp24 [Acinetobacter phage IMEAB3]AHI60023.1 hypothetical protein IME_AB3_24 [Acinetobacter phage IMEAB3]QBG78737.1 hypothetical protein vBAbaSD0_43 [Acinetobacter phage vB_AbaS_D0]HCH8772127.1 hypothetical protein [Salmonella enterica]HCH9143065.1 hypothetical protein [Salmonella enterica]
MDLNDFIRHCDGLTFKWGVFDCCQFAGKAIAVQCGKNPMDTVPHYVDETTASIALRERFGTVSVRDAFLQIADEYGAEKVLNNSLKDGDILSIDFTRYGAGRHGQVDQSFGMGVFYLGSIYVCLQPRGLARLGNDLTLTDAWRFA